MASADKRIAVNCGGGFVPGLNYVVAGVVLAATRLGWETVGIRDGFEGLLFPGQYPEGGLVELTPKLMGDLAGATGCVVGTSPRNDPFRVRTVTADDQVEEVDRSDELLERLRQERIEEVVSIVGSRSLGTLFRLGRKGLRTVCVPKSVENDVVATSLSFGFNSALGFVADVLERVSQAARTARQIGVVEVPGAEAGWLALQAGLAVCADAVLIPEIPYELEVLAAAFREKAKSGRPWGLIVAAEGAKPAGGQGVAVGDTDAKMRAALSPASTGGASSFVIGRSGRVATEIARQIQRMTDQTTHPLVLGELARGGPPTVVDRQLGLGCGAGAVRALAAGHSGVAVVFQPPDLKFVPLPEVLNRTRTVPADCEFVRTARALGITLGN